MQAFFVVLVLKDAAPVWPRAARAARDLRITSKLKTGTRYPTHLPAGAYRFLHSVRNLFWDFLFIHLIKMPVAGHVWVVLNHKTLARWRSANPGFYIWRWVWHIPID